MGPSSTDGELQSSVNEQRPVSFVDVSVGRRGKCVNPNSWASDLFVAKGRTRYCGLFRGPHVEKCQYMCTGPLNYCVWIV